MTEEEELLQAQKEIEAKLIALRGRKQLEEAINRDWDMALRWDHEFNEERDAKLAEQKKLDAIKPITIKVNKLEKTEQTVVIDFPYRVDISDYVASVRKAVGMNGHSIPLVEWTTVFGELTKFPKCDVWFRAGVEQEIETALAKPTWKVEIYKNQFKLTCGPDTNTFVAWSITGVTRDRFDSTIFYAPLGESVGLWNTFSTIEGVQFTDEAKDLILKQVEKQAALDGVALMEDYDFGEYIFHPDAKNEKGEKFEPMGFQNVGVRFAELANGNCLIADVPGLGKTCQGLGYSLRLDKHLQETENRNARVLIICGASLKPNWSRHVRNLTGTVPYTASGTQPDKIDMVTLLTDSPRYVIANYDIIARAQEEVKETVDPTNGWVHQENKLRYFWVELINLWKPDLVLIDEAHYLKNDESKRSIASRLLKCPRFLTLTGTPVLNRPGEFWPVLTLAAPTIFPSKQTFLNNYTTDGVNPKNTKKLHELLRPLMIRRTRKDVQKDLPLVNRINMYRELSPKALKLYKKVLGGVYDSVAMMDARGREGSKEVTNVLVQIQRMKQICAIDSVDDTVERALEFADEMSGSGEPAKVIIFSQFKAIAYAISQRLGGEGVLCFIKRGAKEFITISQSERDDMVREFQTNPAIKFIVVTEKTAKEGHDMTEAGAVFFNDLFWTPAAHEQGEGRAYGRLNNPHGINAYYSVVEHTITEWIVDLLEAKRNMIEEVVDGVEGSRDISIVMEIIDRLRKEMH